MQNPCLWLIFWLVTLLPLARYVEGATPGRPDPHSFGNPQEIRVTHVALDLTTDFDQKQLRGTATLRVARQPGVPSGVPLRLDTRDLTVASVTAGTSDADMVAVPFELGSSAPGASPSRETKQAAAYMGVPLSIAVPEAATQVRIAYRTAPTASALQWLDPAHTSGKTHPFLFTQSQAIHARSWIPLQDSPGVRVSYSATIRVPEGLKAVMSADHLPTREGEDGVRFEMPQPIPPYLIALAVGDLAFRSLGPKTGVYAEPSVVEAAADEFRDAEAMIASVEKRFGPYRWGRYDVLVLPPSFPFGGMENPKLTFATPTIIAGDRSLVALVAHELAHSWSGNFVTNATWDDLWLNEGFTTYLERRIVEDLYGADRSAMERALGLRHLREEFHVLPAKDHVLHADLRGRDPDDGISGVPYEKGALFLATLERSFGRARFDEFLRAYFAHFAFQSLTTADFERFLHDRLLASDERAARAVNVHAWLYEPGLPPGFDEPKSARLEAVTRKASDWSEGKVTNAELETRGWSFHEWLHFLRTLPPNLPADKMADLDAAFRLSASGNSEIVAQWLLMAIRSRYAAADARLEAFLTTVGRRKFVKPLYGELVKTAEGKARAKSIYAKARPLYHPITTQAIDRILER